MKITIVTGFFLPVPAVMGGSTEKIWHRLAEELARRGHEMTLVSRAWPGFAKRETVAGVAHRRLRGANHSRWLGINLLRDLVWGLRVARNLPPADIVISATLILPIWLRRFKPRAGRVVALVARMPKGRGRAYGNVDRLFAPSQTVASRLQAENPRLAGRISLVPYPVDWAQQAGAVGREEAGPVTIGFVGRIHPEKGIGLLLAAAAKLAARRDLPPWRLEIVGPIGIAAGGGGTAWRDALLEKFGPELGPRLAFRDPDFNAESLARRYRAMDIFCYPSLAAKGETFGVAVAEAMAAGCAPIVSNLECFRGQVRDGETGLIFDQTDPMAELLLAESLALLLADRPRRQAIARRAQAHARQFDYAVVADTVVRQLELTLEER
jgi:glycosyltransferase involved in cell wall biosynthesis